jgi:chromate transporter
MNDLIRVFGRIGLLSFGGPAAQIALMHRELVDRRGWLAEAEFLRALSFCMLLPGPEAMQLATYAGWKRGGIPGGLIGGGLFVLPGALVITALALLYGQYAALPLVQALFLGVKATVVVIVIEAILRVAKRALKRPGHWVIAGLAFLGLFAFNLPFPLVIALAGLWGALTATAGVATDVPTRLPTGHLPRVILIGGSLWAAPLLLAYAFGATFLTAVGLFFSKLAIVTFGGAYAVLAYMTQAVVTDYGWLTTPQMMDALGLAETTPGPLILVTQFVGILAGQAQGGTALGLVAGALVLWVTFVPCFIWIFAGAPMIDWIATRPRLTGALAAITAAVVGVILNLSLWFAAHVFFGRVGILTSGPLHLVAPDPASLQWPAVGLALIAGYLLLWRHWSLPGVLALMAALGLCTRLL